MAKFDVKKALTPNKKQTGFLLVLFLFFIAILSIGLSEYFNRLDYAQQVLTEADFEICREQIGTITYFDCWTHLTETNQKDLSALWGGVGLENQ